MQLYDDHNFDMTWKLSRQLGHRKSVLGRFPDLGGENELLSSHSLSIAPQFTLKIPCIGPSYPPRTHAPIFSLDITSHSSLSSFSMLHHLISPHSWARSARLKKFRPVPTWSNLRREMFRDLTDGSEDSRAHHWTWGTVEIPTSLVYWHRYWQLRYARRGISIKRELN